MRHVSGITFIRYAQNREIGKPNNLKVFGSNKSTKWTYREKYESYS